MILLSGFFDFLTIRFHQGSFKIMWSVGISALLTVWWLKRDFRSMGWGWGEWCWLWLAFLIPMGYCLVRTRLAARPCAESVR